MNRDSLTKKVLQVVSLEYSNIIAKIIITILFAIIFAKSIAIHITIPQKYRDTLSLRYCIAILKTQSTSNNSAVRTLDAYQNTVPRYHFHRKRLKDVCTIVIVSSELVRV